MHGYQYPGAQAPKCAECQAKLVRTSERYLCCPQGHGRLVPNHGGRYGKARLEDVQPAVAYEKALKYLRKVERGLS